jgi:thymidine kinase
MFSGKTSSLIHYAERYQRAKLRVIVIFPELDTRFTRQDKIITHNGISYDAIRCKSLKDIEAQTVDYQVILIDEAQFVEDIYLADAWAKSKIVIAAGLISDWQRRPFGNLIAILSLADHIVTLSAVCANCGKDASFSAKKIPDHSSSGAPDIGGEDKYVSLCRECHYTQSGAQSKSAVVPVSVNYTYN